MKRPWLIAVLFGVCLAVVLVVLGWTSLTLLRLDRATAEAQRESEREEDVRLALWRMDSYLSTLLAQENVQPFTAYSAFSLGPWLMGGGKAPMPAVISPLLTAPSPHVLLHFQFDPQGKLTSPEVPVGSEVAAAERQGVTPAAIAVSSERLKQVQAVLNQPQLLSMLPAQQQPAPIRVGNGLAVTPLPDNPASNLQPNNSPSNLPPNNQPTAHGGSMANGPPQMSAPNPNSEENPTQALVNAPSPQAPFPQQVESYSSQAIEPQQADYSQQKAAQPQGGQGKPSIPRFTKQAQQERNVNEYLARSSYAVGLNAANDFNLKLQQFALPQEELQASFMRPLWIGDALYLVRRVEIEGQTFLQGCWVDWSSLRTALLVSVADLLPGAGLQPVTEMQARTPWLPPPRESTSGSGSSSWSSAPPVGKNPGRMLATLPVMLVPGPLAAMGDAAPSPIGLSLVVAWICALLAGVAVAILLGGVVTLSERRGAFVSAVTHELRTPLTTFRMYAEMLAEGMVPQEQRRHYLDTLRGEAERLTRLVENVLAYARLERGRHTSRVQTVSLEKLLEPATAHLRERVEQEGMQFVTDIDPAAAATLAQADSSAVEQILANLVDNACKYGAKADGQVRLEAGRDGATLYIRVRDDGPGLSRSVARRLFRPFTKSAQEAANSAPGIGLGLALSRRLARDMGGELRLEESSPGASFILTMPAA